MTSSIDGLVSGMSTSSVIKSLMQVEAAPRDRLKTKVTAAEKVVTSYLSVNNKLQALKTASGALGKLDTWRAVKPTASSTAVTAAASGGTNTATGSVTFDVAQLAAAQVQTARFSAAPDVVIATKTYGAPVTNATSFDLQVGAETPVTVTLGVDKSPKGIADAINAKGAGVRATVLTTGSGEKILQLSSAKTGAANVVSLTGLSLEDPALHTPVALAEQVAAADAVIDVHVAGGYQLTSPTNTFSKLMPGVTVTATKVEAGITLDTTADIDGIAAKFQAVVEAANAALSEIATQSAYDPATRKGSPLSGDFAIRQVNSSLLSIISQGLGKLDPADADVFGSLRQLGIQLNDTGTGLKEFDAGAFKTAFNANPEKIKDAGIAFADAIGKLAKDQTANVESVVNGRKNMIENMNVQIDNWAVRLTARQEALQKQYAGLETALGKLNSQSTWLSGQLSGLG